MHLTQHHPSLPHIYDTLDFIHQHKKQIITRLNTKLIQHTGRKNNVIYYDVTNFFFEIDRQDEDFENEEGTIVKGIRKDGVCKEERKLPIVHMGLFMDENGIPISIEIFPGNTLDHLTVSTALSNNIDDVINSRFIFIADRGICNYPTICHLLDRSKAYIMSKSIKKVPIKKKNGYLIRKDILKKAKILNTSPELLEKKLKIQKAKQEPL